ncbi:MAG: LysR family transcriptional regulator [Pseudomonadota bacterium]
MNKETLPSEFGDKKFALLFEMLRSFTVLAHELNLSRAVERLGSTRQTVRRHISLLQEIKGGALFDIQARQYALTPLGKAALPEAIDLLSRADAWARGQISSVDGLQRLAAATEDGWFFHLQQHQLLRVHDSTSPLMGDILNAWATSGGRIETPAFKRMRNHAMIFRKMGDQWLFIEVGEESGFAHWVGLTYARSALGRPMVQLPSGIQLERVVQSSYQSIELTGSARYDHIFTVFPRGDDRTPTPLCYERLLMAIRLPDESLAVMSAARPTYDISIADIDPKELRRMPADLLM